MMTASGVVYLSNTRPRVTRSADGIFALTLLAFDRVGPHSVEPWRIVWSGPAAQAFWSACQSHLNPGQPIQLQAHTLRNFTTAWRLGGPEIVAQATSIELAPLPAKRGMPAPVARVVSY